jgi:hypothetical protein
MRAVAFATICSLLSFAAKADVEGSMRCTVQSNAVTVIEDGRTSNFTDVEGEFVVGDILTLTYGVEESWFQEGEYRDWLDLELSDEHRDETVLLGSTQVQRCDSENICFRESEETSFISVTFRDSFIRIENPLINARFYRYYRSDWHGMLIRRRWPNDPASLAVQVVTLDCRAITDRIPEVLEALLGATGNN